MKAVALRDRGAFALLAPGFGRSSRWILLSDLVPASDGELVFQRFEATAPERFSGRRTEVEVELEPGGAPQVELAPGHYARDVESIREDIARGDVYQVCLTLRAHVSGVDGAQLLSALCARGVPRFAAWVRFPDGTELVSGSPELLLEREGEVVRSEPMKGTASARAGEALQGSEKDRAELAMITDLVRNDLTPVCRPRSIRVPADREQRVLPYAIQTVSRVKGTLEDGRDDLDALAALHPGGSVTGAPKQAALERIARLEPGPRGVYCGVLGLREEPLARYALLIRTAERSGEAWIYGVGSGVVYDSTPEAEWAELGVKLQALGTDPRLPPLR